MLSDDLRFHDPTNGGALNFKMLDQMNQWSAVRESAREREELARRAACATAAAEAAVKEVARATAAAEAAAEPATADMATCSLCLCEEPRAKGISCDAAATAASQHFACDECFSAHVARPAVSSIVTVICVRPGAPLLW